MGTLRCCLIRRLLVLMFLTNTRKMTVRKPSFVALINLPVQFYKRTISPKPQ